MQSRPTNWVDLQEVKHSVSLETILLSHYGLRLRRIGRTLRGRCPLPTHDPQKTAPSFMVNTAKNVFSCHSQGCIAARDGKVGGTVLDFVALMERCSIAEAGRKIQNWIGIAAPLPARLPSVEKNDNPPERNNPLHFALTGIDHSHPYLTGRGVSTEIAAAFGIGYYGEPGIMKGRVVIPVHNPNGELVAYAGRAIDGAEPKYRFPRGFLKAAELFNLHRAIATEAREIIVVEGFFDCVNMHQAGIQNVVALMGRTLSKAQQELLTSRFEKVILMLDGDTPGREASRKIADQLSPHVSVSVVEVPDGKQPDQLSGPEIRGLFATDGKSAQSVRPTIPESVGPTKLARDQRQSRSR